MLYFPYTRPKLANLSVFKSYIRKQPKIVIYAQKKKKNKNKNKKQNKTKQKTLHDRRDWKSQLIKIVTLKWKTLTCPLLPIFLSVKKNIIIYFYHELSNLIVLSYYSVKETPISHLDISTQKKKKKKKKKKKIIPPQAYMSLFKAR